MKGRLLPLGWLAFLRGKRKIDRVRVFALGVKHEYRHTGVAAGLYLKHLEAASPDGVAGGEMGWILETNEPMNRAMEGMGGQDRQAVPHLREGALTKPATCGLRGRRPNSPAGIATVGRVMRRMPSQSAQVSDPKYRARSWPRKTSRPGTEQPVRALARLPEPRLAGAAHRGPHRRPRRGRGECSPGPRRSPR